MNREELERAVAEGTDLRRADLRGAYLRGAYLEGANLEGADLRRADLRRAYLRRADLRRADLRGAYLRGADRQDHRGYRFVGVPQPDGTLRILAGCRWFTVEEAQLHWADNPEAFAKVDLLINEHKRRTRAS